MIALKYNDSELIDMIQAGGLKRNNALKHIFLNQKIVNSIKSMCQNMSNGTIEMEDIRQDAIIAFDRNIRHGKFNEKSAISSYIISIAKFMILNAVKKKSKTNPITIDQLSTEDHPIELYQEIQSVERKNLINKIIEEAGSKCKEMLALYVVKTPMKEIADMMGFAQEQGAKNAIFRCRKKLKKWFLEAKLH